MPFAQQHRAISVSTSLGEDVLLLRSMSGSERLSSLFEYRLEMLSEDINIDHKDLLGQPATIKLSLAGGGARYFNGIVNSFSYVGFDGAKAIYRAKLVPWAWFLTRTADCRIFQEKSVPDIIKDIFREQGFTDFEECLTNTYVQWVYCAQYRETDFNFVSRLMEQEGIYYYFKHQHGSHTLVLSDDYSAHATIAGYEKVPYYPPDDSALREREHISDWVAAQEVQPGAYVHTDYDFTATNKDLLTKRVSPKSHQLADFEVFDYPGKYMENTDGENYARIRHEELHADYESVHARTSARGLGTGALFTLTKYPREDQNREYLVVSTNYRIQSDAYGSDGSGGQGTIYDCTLSAINAQTPFRPPRITPKPVIQGPQTAVVVGKSGEEIWTDEYGRVKVQFHWDRYGKSDENSSCWVRVSQPWAGKNWGAIAIPRIRQEVIVEFLEGDPDRPIITGRVYNNDQMPPYDLPANQTRTGIKSRSSKEGSQSNCNEIRMEDKKGEEELLFHAERNQTIEVEADESHWVGHDRTKNVDNDETTVIGNNRTESVGADETIDIGGNRKETVAGDETIDIGVNRSESVGANEDITIGANLSQTVGASVKQDIGASLTQTVGGPWNMTAQGPVLITAPAGLTIVSPAGNRTVDNIFDQIGGTLKETFGFESSVVNSKYDATGVSIGQTAEKIETTGQSFGATGTAMETKGINMAYVVLAVEKTSFKIQTVDAKVIA